MVFTSVSDFLYMGGHGLYVWLAYAAGAIVLIYNIAEPAMQKKAVLKKLAQQIKREKRYK